MDTFFEIESVFKLTNRNTVVVFARLLNSSEADWRVTDNSQLGDVEIEPFLEIPRALDKNGDCRLDLFAFKLKRSEDKDKLQTGQVVELTGY